MKRILRGISMQRKWTAFFVFFCISLSVCFARQEQSDVDYITAELEKTGYCHNMAITQYSGIVAIYGTNGFIQSGVPASLVSALEYCNTLGLTIDDVCLTEQGCWYITGDELNGAGYPADVDSFVEAALATDERITCVSFNDRNIVVVISEGNIWCNDNRILSLLISGMQQYGYLYSVCITNKGLVACYEQGYVFDGSVPSSLKNYLQSPDTHIGDIHYVKFADDGSWFVADLYGNYCAYL